MTEYIEPPPPVWVKGEKGDPGPQGLPGGPGGVGPSGSDGSAFTMLGSVPVYSALPSSGNLPGFAYHVIDSGKIFIWSGNAWIDAGRWRGFSGTPGSTGVTGAPGFPGSAGAPGAPGDATDITDWVNSRGVDNLISNGTGYLRDFTNFSQFQYIVFFDPPVDATASFGCNVVDATVTTDELVTLVLDQEYAFWFFLKQREDTVPLGTFKAGIACFDGDGAVISPIHYAHLPNTTTTLAQDLSPGDGIIHLTDSTNWYDGPDEKQRALICWDYVNNQGIEFAPHTYSRHVSDEGAWAEGAIDTVNHSIVLTEPWVNGTLAAGTPVSNAVSGDAHVYAISGEATLEWVKHAVRFTYKTPDAATASTGRGIMSLEDGLPPGTVTVKPAWELNHDTEQGSAHSIGSILLSTTVALGLLAKETLEAVMNLEEDLAEARVTIENAETLLNQAQDDINQALSDSAQAKADALAATGVASDASQEAQDAWNKAVEAEKQGGVVKIDSSRGLLFKHNAIDTQLTVTIYKGDRVIDNILDLRDEYGAGAYLEWYYQLMDETTWGVISSADSRLSNGGFMMTISPDEVDEKTSFKVVVHGD